MGIAPKVLGLAAGILICMGTKCILIAQAQIPPKTPKIIALLPEGFRGWVCVDFGDPAARPLPREGDALVVRIRQGEVVKTSDQLPGGFFYPELWFEINGKRNPVPDDWTEVRQASEGMRHCVFHGSVDDADAAPDPPGIAAPAEEKQGVSNEERKSLIALYRATGGDHWYHRVGWLGPPGTECKWHGVQCWPKFNEPVAVRGLDLSENNLVGKVPPSLSGLTHLEDLGIYGNHLAGTLPQKFLDRYFARTLWVTADTPQLTDVTQIEYESDPSALLCGRYKISLGSDNRASFFTVRCRNATPQDRTTFCEVKQGRISSGAFAHLALLLDKNGFYGFQAHYYRDITDSTFDTTRVIRGGKHYEVEDYAGAGPFELWVIETAIEGVSSEIEWEKTTTQPTCPK